MKFGEILRKLYFIKWVRIPVKLIISYTTYKLIWDIYEYITMYRNDPGFPRFTGFDLQSPTNPPIPIPHPYYANYEEYQHKKAYNQLIKKIMKLKEIGPDKKHVFIEAPCRENINSIDQLILRAKEYSCSQHLKYFVINEYAQKGQPIPPTVFKQIRDIHKDEVEINEPVIPKM